MGDARIEEKEHKIISHLRKDARSSFVYISYDVNMPVSTVYDRISRLNKDQVITRFTTLLNFPKLGFHHQAALVAKVDRIHKEKLDHFLRHHPAVNTLYEVSNGYDFFFETVHRDAREYLEFIYQLKGMFVLYDLLEFQVLRDIERERFLA